MSLVTALAKKYKVIANKKINLKEFVDRYNEGRVNEGSPISIEGYQYSHSQGQEDVTDVYLARFIGNDDDLTPGDLTLREAQKYMDALMKQL